MTKKIGVLGCGWLGLPLAKHLIDHSYIVHGTTTSASKIAILRNEGIHPHKIVLSESGIEGDIQNLLSQIEVLIIDVPPKLRGKKKESFIAKMELLHADIKKSEVSRIIFVSSTAVYGDVKGTVTEATIPKPVTESGKQLLASEQLFHGDAQLKSTIIRFGGLIGPNRHPVTMLSKRQNLSNGNDPVNLIHLNDCIHIISTILENKYWSEFFNGVYPLHPTKMEYYSYEAKKRGIPAPDYSNSAPSLLNKIIESKNFLDKSHKLHTSILS